MAVLVGYASAHGSTKGIAERIARRLNFRGVQADLEALSAKRDCGAHDAFVLGSAIHDRAWLPETDDFVRCNISALISHPVWMFSVGMQDTPAMGVLRGLFKKAELPAISRLRKNIHPIDYRYFGGAIYPKQLPLAGRLFVRLSGGSFGDFRSWEEIDAWADAIAAHLKTTPVDAGREIRLGELAGRR